MAKQRKKKTRKSKQKSTDWQLGQPLAFPQKKNPTDSRRPAAREVAEAAIREPLVRKQKKKAKKKALSTQA